MCSGPKLHLMALFEALEAGFCTEFRRASFVCSSPGADFGSPGRKLGPPRSDFGVSRSTLRDVEVFGLPQKTLLRGNDFLVGMQGNPSCPNELYGP